MAVVKFDFMNAGTEFARVLRRESGLLALRCGYVAAAYQTNPA